MRNAGGERERKKREAKKKREESPGHRSDAVEGITGDRATGAGGGSPLGSESLGSVNSPDPEEWVSLHTHTYTHSEFAGGEADVPTKGARQIDLEGAGNQRRPLPIPAEK